ncbi:MAG: RNA methyltransferase [Erysipelotrichaceae bacterium]|nr:RNA methyltransferase [Erysipelotrichaceae bacterium]
MITSLDNKTVKNLTKLHQKKYREDRFLVLDDETLKEAHAHDQLIQLVYSDELPFPFENTLQVSEEVMRKISKKDDQKYLGVSRMIKENDDYGKRVILLDELQDPLNIGRIMEAALLFGFDSVILSPGCADIYNEKCLSNSRGAIYSLNLCHKDLLEEIKTLQQNGCKVYATGLRNETRMFNEIEASDRMAFVLGNEGSGVREEIMDLCDEIVKIDMRNIDSLNVAMAAAIIMYHFSI